MSYQQYRIGVFDSTKAGLSTVGYQLFDESNVANGSRVNINIHDLHSGSYGALISFPDSFNGRIQWDTGETIPSYFSEAVYDPRTDLNQQVNVFDLTYRTDQDVGDCLSAARADAVGAMQLDINSKVQTLYGPNGNVVRQFVVDDVTTPTVRN